MSDDDYCRELLEDAPSDEDPCAHWHDRAFCSEPCSCGHACGEHYGWGGCALCACIAWEDARDAVEHRFAPRPTTPDDVDPWDEDIDEAAGF